MIIHYLQHRQGVQGITGCGACGRCAACSNAAQIGVAGAALAWDMGEICGLAKPDRLPAPTTSSLARTIIVRPEPLSFCRLDIRDAERAQGMEADYTWLPATAEPVAALTAVQLRAKRFACVGNGLVGKVRHC